MRRPFAPGRSQRSCAPLTLAGRAAVLTALASAACGRIGYDLLPSSTTSAESSGGSGGSADASVDAAMGGAGGVLGADASFSGGAGGTANGGTSSGGTGGSRDGGTDARTGSGGASCSAAVATVADYCTGLPRLTLPVTIDGELDCGLPIHPLSPEGWTDGPAPPDVTAEYAVAWRPDGLYFFLSVDDPSLVPAAPGDPVSDGDAVELFVDDDGRFVAPPAYGALGTRSFAIAAPADALVSTAHGEISSPPNAGFPTQWQSTTFRAFPRAGGYAIEAFVVGADLGVTPWVLTAGVTVGFDLGIDVSLASTSGDAGRRRGRFFLQLGHVATDAAAPDAGATLPVADPRAFCTPSLMP